MNNENKSIDLDNQETITNSATNEDNIEEDNIITHISPLVALDNKIILEAVSMYHKLNSSYEEDTFNLLPEEGKIKQLLQTKIFLLNGRKISKIDNLDIYANLEELYLQRNSIREISGMEYLTNLIVLNLHDNFIRKISHISHLHSLEILDISDNLIECFEIEEIPENLMFVNMFDNLFYENTSELSYRSQLIIKCSYIARIDRLDVTEREKLILIDPTNLLKREISVKKSLKFITEHYKCMKDERQKYYEKIKTEVNQQIPLEKETISTNTNDHLLIAADLKKKEIPIDQPSFNSQKESTFITNSIGILKDHSNEAIEKSHERKKKFGESEDIKNLKEKLNELSKKFENSKFMDEHKKEEMRQKIERAFNFEEKLRTAEDKFKEVTTRIREKKLCRREVKIEKPLDEVPEEPRKRIKNPFDIEYEIKDPGEGEKCNLNENSLLTELSDISMIENHREEKNKK